MLYKIFDKNSKEVDLQSLCIPNKADWKMLNFGILIYIKFELPYSDFTISFEGWFKILKLVVFSSLKKTGLNYNMTV